MNMKQNVDQYFMRRDPRGFAVKFYTEEGIWDLIGNNTPIFFIKDPLLFPSFIHTQKRNPTTHLKVRSKELIYYETIAHSAANLL